MNRQTSVAIGCLTLLTACSYAPATVAHQSVPARGTTTPLTNANRPAKPMFGHVIVVIMENQEITAARQAPYLHSLAQQYALVRSYTAVTHPSLPNHLALTGGDTFGFDGRNCVVGPDCHIPGTNTNIADELEGAGLTWKAYIEAMPEPCATEDSGTYAVRHNPFVYYDDIREDRERCITHVVPFEQFQHDLDFDMLPNYAWITPDLCHGTHNRCGIESGLQHLCSKLTEIILPGMREHCGIQGRLRQGDDWLAVWIPRILASKQFQADGVLFITFDEGKDDAGCYGAPGGGRVLTLVISGVGAAKRSGWASETAYNHYSLLRTIEDNWGLPHLGHAGAEDIVPMDNLFDRVSRR